MKNNILYIVFLLGIFSNKMYAQSGANSNSENLALTNSDFTVNPLAPKWKDDTVTDAQISSADLSDEDKQILKNGTSEGGETVYKFTLDAANGATDVTQIVVTICPAKFDFIGTPVVSEPGIFDRWVLKSSGCYKGYITKDLPKLTEIDISVRLKVRENTFVSIADQPTVDENTGNAINVNLTPHNNDDTKDDDKLSDATFTCDPLLKRSYPPNSVCRQTISTAIVPVELTSFTAKAKGSDAVLNWETATEANSSHFNVQRSFDGVAFTTIGKVESAGTTQVAQAYSFTDRNASAKGSTLYYRLQQVDADATTSTTEIRVVNFDGNVESKVFPNPASLGSNVQIQGNSIETVQVISTDGKTVADYQVGGKNGFSLPTTDLSAGAYILLVNGEKSNLIIE